ncbi:MAG: glycosyltransferase family 2 protein [Bacteroidales bacterium]|jgi:glycosyltransferase involved in cell wall biosynthesis
MQLVSVIIPTYNSAPFINRTITSVINQVGFGETFNVQLIIADDNSTDNTVELCERFKQIFKKGSYMDILTTTKNSGGPNNGRNIGLMAAQGDVVCFLDHDDEWMPHKIHNQLKQIEYGADFVYSPCIKEKG